MRGEKDINISVLTELYGVLLTEKQREMLDMYYNLDYSLSEIAENTGISRQGVLDNIKHGEARLNELESALGVKHKFENTERALSSIESALENAPEEIKKRIAAAVESIRAAWEDKA